MEEDPDIATCRPSDKSNLSLDALDALTHEDESLRRYKAALLGNLSLVDASQDPRRFFLTAIAIDMQGHPKGPAAYCYDMTSELDVARFTTLPIIFMENCIYQFILTFKVQHNICTNLQMKNKTSKAGLTLYTQKMFCGTFAPVVDEHVWVSEPFEAPGGWLARTTFTGAVSIFDDDTVHTELKYNAEVKQGWG